MKSKRYEATKFGCHVVWEYTPDEPNSPYGSTEIISAEIVDEDELLNAVCESGEEVAD